jgi:hypothetical protein
MAANQPESRISPTTAGWSWQCGLELSPIKDVFSVSQVLSSVPRRPHAVSKALGRHWHWFIHRQKPVIGGLNPQDLSSCCLHYFCLPLSHGIRSMSSFGSFFILRIRFMLHIAEVLMNLHIVLSLAEHWAIIGGKPSSRYWGPNLIPSPIYTIACTAT